MIDDDTIVASAQIQRVAQLAGTAPLVVATERPRDADVDAVLAFADALVVVVPQDATPALVALACDGEPRPTRVVRTDITATVGTLALSGVPVLPALRRLGAELATEA
ncbi:hypothetical protein [Paraconexibacter sp.]|uniref:hypothetical protein n=1 Tax=Paraconexibacter sp. TaxID=2949640 RepID=UPI00356A6336